MALIRFLLDENIDRRVAVALRQIGADVLTANDARTLGHTDREQFDTAIFFGRVFVTHDKDLLDTVKRARAHPGLIYIYRAHYTAQDTALLLADIHQSRTAEELRGRIIVFRDGPSAPKP